MKASDFVVKRRPHLRGIMDFPKVDMAIYQRRVAHMQDALRLVQQAYLGTHERAVVVLEGWDTAGKGGVVRRLGWALDPRSFKVHAVAAPTAREKSLHYLQRFWERLPEHGQIVVFDRSWYGRVLVERVEGYATPFEWQRAYAEINEFEDELAGHGLLLIKFWLHITEDEQYRRFKQREQIAYKSWKLTEEDWRNRAKGPAYKDAVNEMVERTGTGDAPWTLVEGNDKNHARIKVMRTVIERLKERVG